MALYWWEDVNVDDPDGILRVFYRRASDELRAHAVIYVGRSLRGNKELPEEIRDRVERWWEWRMEETAKDTGQSKGELAACAWLVGSGKLRPEWALQALEQVLKLSPLLDPEFVVSERLRELAADFPRPVVRCVSLFLLGQSDDWKLHSVRDAAQAALGTVLSSLDPHAVGTAKELINRLAARGFVDYRDLLKPDG